MHKKLIGIRAFKNFSCLQRWTREKTEWRRHFFRLFFLWTAVFCHNNFKDLLLFLPLGANICKCSNNAPLRQSYQSRRLFPKLNVSSYCCIFQREAVHISQTGFSLSFSKLFVVVVAIAIISRNMTIAPSENGTKNTSNTGQIPFPKILQTDIQQRDTTREGDWRTGKGTRAKETLGRDEVGAKFHYLNEHLSIQESVPLPCICNELFYSPKGFTVS